MLDITMFLVGNFAAIAFLNGIVRTLLLEPRFLIFT